MEGYPVNLLNNSRYVSDSNSLPINITHFAPSQTDAFGRLRMSQPITLFDSFHRFQDNGKINQYISGDAVSAFNSNAGCIEMTVNTQSNAKVFRESARVLSYQPGKSLLILESFSFSPPEIGLRQRIGYFDTSNGIFLQLENSNLSFVRRSSVSGQVIDTVVPRADWNVDRLDGTGPMSPTGAQDSITLDATRTQILFIDIEWLGVGTVRTGFVIEGQYKLCHRFHHANQPSTATTDTTKPYMLTACLPLRAEIETTATTTRSHTMCAICSSVMSEGGYDLRGIPLGIGWTNLSTPKNLPLADALYPVIAIRLKSSRLNAIIIPTQFHVVGTTSATYRWALVQRATITGGNAWLSADTNSSVEYKLDGTNAITDGIVKKMGYFSSSQQSTSVVNMDNNVFSYQLERNSFTGEAYTFVLAVAASGPNNKVLGGMDFEELT
jgi:hypothetical protein